jgi:hypothetical protein
MKYTCKSVNPITKESTIYVGLVVDAVLSSAILRAKTTELVTAWPLLGGRIIRRVGLMPFLTLRILCL